MTTMKERLRDPRFTGPRFWSAAALAFALATTACATGPKTVDPATSSLIKGDAAVQYEKVIQVLDLMGRLDITQLGLVTQRLVK